jgi:hypothetical protein
MAVPARDLGEPAAVPERELADKVADSQARLVAEARARLGGYLQEESDKLDRWRADAELSFDERIKKLGREANERSKQAKLAQGLDEKLALQREAAELKREADGLKRAYYQRLDEIDAEREKLLNEIAGKLDLTPSLEPLFTIRWTVAA